jgi:hypothetical protein
VAPTYVPMEGNTAQAAAALVAITDAGTDAGEMI